MLVKNVLKDTESREETVRFRETTSTIKITREYYIDAIAIPDIQSQSKYHAF